MGLDITAVREGMLAGIRLASTAAMQTVFPPRCIACGERVEGEFGLCGACWGETSFILGLACDCCGAPLPGEEAEQVLCDECLRAPRAWERGRAAMVYSGTGRRLVLAFKHGDRLDLTRPLSGWMHRAAGPILEPGMIVAPVPLHRLRLLKRRYNQSALLAKAVARQAGLDCLPDLFERTRATPPQEGLSAAARAENLAGAIALRPKYRAQIAGRAVLIVDDVLTTGATLTATAEAAREAGAQKVVVLTLARVAKEP